MNMHTSIALLAAALTPAYAQQSSEPIPATPATVPAVALAPALLAAEPFGALAVLPADLDFFFAVNDIRLILLQVGVADHDLPGFDNVAFGAEKGAGKTLLALKTLLTMGGIPAYPEMMIDIKEKYSDVIDGELEKIRRKFLQEALTSGERLHLPPVYIAVQATPGKEDEIQGYIDLTLQQMMESISKNDDFSAVPEEVNGFRGFAVQVKNIPQDAQDEDAMRERLFYKTIGDLHPHILVKRDGNRFIAVVCSNPADAKTISDKASSALSIPGIVPHEAISGDRGILSAYWSPEFAALNNRASWSQMGKNAAVYAELFRALASADEAKKQVFEQAASAIENLAQQVQTPAISYQPTKPTTLHTWIEGKDIRTVISGDAYGYEFRRGQLKLKSKAAAPSTIFYAENTPLIATAATPKWDISTLTQPLFDIARGVLAVLPDEEAAAKTACLQMAENFLPDVRLLGSAFGVLLKGFNGQGALVVDSAGELPPALGQPGNGVPMPRLGAYAEVENRSKLAEGWQEILSAAGKIAARLGADPSVTNMLPIAANINGETASYSIVLPGTSEHLQPNVTLNNSGFAIGTSPALNADLLQSATGSDDFSGCEFVLKIDPLATVANGIRNHIEKLRQSTTQEATFNMARPPKQEVCQATCKGDTEEEPSGEEDEDDEADEMEVAYSCSPYDDAAMRADNFSTLLQAISSVVGQIDGRYTIQDGKVNFQINIRRK